MGCDQFQKRDGVKYYQKSNFNIYFLKKYAVEIITYICNKKKRELQNKIIILMKIYFHLSQSIYGRKYFAHFYPSIGWIRDGMVESNTFLGNNVNEKYDILYRSINKIHI